MGAVFGILGDADTAELDQLSERMSHRGSGSAHWSPASGVHLGLRGPAHLVERLRGGNLVFDGFLDNRQALAGGQGRTAIRSPDQDADLLLELLSQRGVEILQDLAGQFAFALWDSSRHELLLARDRIGYAPLYFTSVGRRVIFASEYKALLAISSVPARPNRDAIQVIQSTKWVLPGATCLEGVYPVAPGTWTSIQRDQISTARFWDLPIRVVDRDEQRQTSRLREAFLETLKLQTAPYQRIGISLSGGLDSAVMAAGARHVAEGKEIHTFSAGYGPDDKELVNAEQVARELGTHHHPLVLDPDDLPSLLPWMVWHLEEPIGREDIAYLYVAAREAARYVDLILTGFGFDGLFAGLPRHRVAHAALHLPPAERPLREFYDYTVRGVEPAGIGGRALKSLYFRGRDFPAPQVLGARPVQPLRSFKVGGDQPLSQFLRKGFMVSPYQSPVERLYTAAGVRFNCHHTDPQFLATAFAIPDRLKIKGRTQKYILRKACSGLLPQSILNFGKSFNRLKHDLHLSSVLDQLADRYLSPQATAERGLFDPAYIARLRSRPQDRPYSQERVYRLWSLILAEMWNRMYLDSRGAPPSGPSWAN